MDPMNQTAATTEQNLLTSEQNERMQRSKKFWKSLAEFQNQRVQNYRTDDIIEDCAKLKIDDDLTIKAIQATRDFQEWLDHAYGEDEHKPIVCITISYWTIGIALGESFGLWYSETDSEDDLTLEHLVSVYKAYVETLVEPFRDTTEVYDEESE